VRAPTLPLVATVVPTVELAATQGRAVMEALAATAGLAATKATEVPTAASDLASSISPASSRSLASLILAVTPRHGCPWASGGPPAKRRRWSDDP